MTIRGLSDVALDALRADADAQGRSLNRHLVAVLEAQAERGRRRAELERMRRRLDGLRDRLAAVPADGRRTDSAALLWSERGGR